MPGYLSPELQDNEGQAQGLFGGQFVEGSVNDNGGTFSPFPKCKSQGYKVNGRLGAPIRFNVG